MVLKVKLQYKSLLIKELSFLQSKNFTNVARANKKRQVSNALN